MQTNEISQDSNIAKAASLSTRLEAINETVKTSGATPTLIDASLKIGLAYGIFLTELEDGTTALGQDQIKHMLERTEQHCQLYETEFSALAKGNSEQ